jgi:hypothetical protein
MPGYAALEVKKDELIRKGIQGSVFIADYTAPAISVSTLFSAVTGDLAALPTGYNDLGWTDTTGAVFARKITSTDINSWGTNDPVRSDITADATTMTVVAYQTNLVTIGLWSNTEITSLIPVGVNGVMAIPDPIAPLPRFYRLLAVGIDETSNGEIVFARFLPKAQVTNYQTQSYANGKDPLQYGLDFTAYQDSILGYAQEMIYGGAGWLALLGDMGISRIVICTTALTTTLVATTGTFTAADVGATVSGSGIPNGTTIATFTNSTTVVMSAAGTIAATLVNVAVS